MSFDLSIGDPYKNLASLKVTGEIKDEIDIRMENSMIKARTRGRLQELIKTWLHNQRVEPGQNIYLSG